MLSKSATVPAVWRDFRNWLVPLSSCTFSSCCMGRRGDVSGERVCPFCRYAFRRNIFRGLQASSLRPSTSFLERQNYMCLTIRSLRQGVNVQRVCSVCRHVIRGQPASSPRLPASLLNQPGRRCSTVQNLRQGGSPDRGSVLSANMP